MSYTEALSYYLGAFVDELTRLGVCETVISPGSRSTPLAMLMAEHESMKTYVHVDERSAAYFALGIAKAKRRPVAILCTSGTAAANYWPAVSEAFHSRVPLLILTADRPHELRDVGAPQAMNQLNLFGSFAKEFIEMALPEASERMYQYVRTTTARAIAVMNGAPSGPVHMNFPLREPLIPNFSLPNLWEGGKAGRANQYTSVTFGNSVLPPFHAGSLSKRLASMEKGLIVCGEMNDPSFAEEVAAFAAAYQYPILADPLSNVRSGKHEKENVLECYDAFLRNEEIQNLQPDIIIRFGAMPVSKALTQYIQSRTSAVHLVIEKGGWRDPALIASEMIYADEVSVCRQLTAFASANQRETAWLRMWRELNALAREHLSYAGLDEEPFEGRVMMELADVLPDQSALFVGNSMPIRDVDTFFLTRDKKINILANRGVNGIDGTVSTALGASTHYEPLVLVLGDLSFYHDLNGLLAAKLHNLNATIVVINNDGGGIFSFLPQYAEKKHFEALFGTPLGLDYEHVVNMYHGVFSRPKTWEQFRSAVANGISSNGLHVIEIRTNRESNLQMHRALWATISTSVTERLRGNRNAD